ncbi:MAG: hypothetical protein O2871_01310 [bacterium]|nr:hypothetical protein [bacterium]
MIDLQKRINYEEFLDSYKQIKLTLDTSESAETVEVSKAISALALAYEKVRNVIDYKDEHLIRRFAIERELKRLFLQEDTSTSAERIVKTLIRGNYLQNVSVPVSKVTQLQQTLIKYEHLRNTASQRVMLTPKLDKTTEYVIELASLEIEKLLVPTYAPEIPSVYMASVLEKNIELEEIGSYDIWPVLVASAHRAIHNSDSSTIRFFTFILLNPQWANLDLEQVKALNLDKIKTEIEFLTNNPAFDKALLLFRKHAPTFRALEKVMLDNVDDLDVLVEEDPLLRKTQVFLKKVYSTTREKLNRRLTRSIIYIVITKMALALILELPIDRYLEGRINPISLIINIVTPPLILFFIALAVKAPNDSDITNLLKVVKQLFDTNSILPENKKIQISFNKKGRTFVDYIFFGFYALLTILLVWVSYSILNAIGYNFASYIIFLFFLSVVSYFGYTIASSAAEYKVRNLNEGGFLTFLGDTLSLPVIRMGRKLSQGVSKINLFVFILDFIIESPFKLLVEFLEQWLGYVREKREETIA